MRKVTFGAACSLDGYIALPDDGVDWLNWSDDVASVTADFWKTIDAVVMGRKTYEVAVRSGTPAYPGVANYVFTRNPSFEAAEGVHVVSEDAEGFVRRLKHGVGRGICVMGGGEFARSLFDAGLIDEVGLNIHPILLGSGIPMFHPMQGQIDLELLESRGLDGGCTLLTYRVKRRS